MKKYDRSIQFKFIIAILFSCGLLFIGIFLVNYFYSRNIIKDLIQRDAAHLALATVKRIELILYGLEKVAMNAAAELAEKTVDEEAHEMIRRIVDHNGEIYGMTLANDPSITAGTFSAPYWYRGEQGLHFRYLTYDYTVSDWYIIPKEMGKPQWSEPYFDVGGGECLMTTYSVPFYRQVKGEKVFAGVVTADVSLTWLREILSSITIGKTGYIFIISRNGTFISHPDERLIMNESIFSVAEARNDAALRDIGKRMIRGEKGNGALQDWTNGADSWIVFHPFPLAGWSLGIVLPKSELLGDLSKLSHMVVVLGVGGMLLLLVVTVLIGRSITRPLLGLTRSVERIAEGDLDAPLPVISSRDEIARLATSFAHMQKSLKHYIKELAQTISEKERIESELTIAREIQMGILPKVFPPFPERKEFDIYARLQPAREVGGDFYDFFFTDKDHFWVVIGDVSGKGVPASLFMAVTRTLLKAKAEGASSPGAVLDVVNRDLSADNPSLMFVTIFLGMLDCRTGLFTYANGGHNPPYLLRPGEDPQPLLSTKGLALGVQGRFQYRENTLTLKADDALLFYTDGVTEAVNAPGELFSSHRLQCLLAKNETRSPLETVGLVVKEIEAFAGETPQADDITVMVIRFRGQGTAMMDAPAPGE